MGVLSMMYTWMWRVLDAVVVMKALQLMVNDLYDAVVEYINNSFVPALNGVVLVIPISEVALRLDTDFRMPPLSYTFGPLEGIYNMLNFKIPGTEKLTFWLGGSTVVVGSTQNPELYVGMMDVYALDMMITWALRIIRKLKSLGLTKLIFLFITKLLKSIISSTSDIDKITDVVAELKVYVEEDLRDEIDKLVTELTSETDDVTIEQKVDDIGLKVSRSRYPM